MPSRIQAGRITGFRGLDERRVVGSTEELTSALDNVIVRNGTVKGRLGLALWDGISTAASAIPIGLADFYDAAAATSSLLRMLPTAMEKWNSSTHAWDDITGTALTGTSSTRPVFHTMTDEGFMVFTNEGHDRPRKYTGSGNTATLGGTPPYAKWLCPFVGFLFLFNTSTDGAFTGIADPITSYFSDQPDVNWDLCAGNSLVFDETAGEVRAAGVVGDYMVVFKADGLVAVRFVGGLTRFTKRKIPFAHGILAPLSLQSLGGAGLIFLATDRNLYITDGQSVQPLPLNVQKSLQETMAASVADDVSGYLDISNQTYHLLYQRDGSTYYDGRLSFNYSTGEFYKGAYSGYEITRALGYRRTNNLASQLVVTASNKKVYEQESGADDAGTSVSRTYYMDWTQLGSLGNKWFTGADLTFTRARDCRVRVSIAVDQREKYKLARTFTLQGTDPAELNTRVSYHLPSPIFGSWFKLKIEMMQDTTTQCELKEIQPEFIPVNPSSEDSDRATQPLKA